jgi:hypothetical protein
MSADPVASTIANDPELATMVSQGKGIQATELLDDVHSFIRRFCIFPDDHALLAVTL